jgi:DNA-binding MarR family transcriptional regulator
MFRSFERNICSPVPAVKVFRSCERNKWYRGRVPPRTPRKPSARRADLLKALHEAGRISSTATIMFHTTMASLRGLAPTETKAIDVLDRHGPMTAGELAAKTGLAPPSVTGLIKRLGRKGFVRRAADPSDGRRVRVELAGHAVAAFAPLFQDFVDRLDALYATYSDDELQLLLGFMQAVSGIQREATARLLAPK